MDAYSRYLICCVGLSRTQSGLVRKVFERVFREFGMPEAIRSDNGSPFASNAPRGLSRLSAWWAQLGIRHERITPGKPQQNGRHERMHLTLKARDGHATAADHAEPAARLRSLPQGVQRRPAPRSSRPTSPRRLLPALRLRCSRTHLG